jgi:alcohol dehydrogenase YqhD (iron-dependent ADH family)
MIGFIRNMIKPNVFCCIKCAAEQYVKTSKHAMMCNARTEDFFEELGISNRLIKQAIDRNKDEN